MEEAQKTTDYDPKKFYNKFTEIALEEIEQRKIEQKIREEKARQVAYGRKNYGEYVLSEHLPIISHEKKIEIELIKNHRKSLKELRI